MQPTELHPQQDLQTNLPNIAYLKKIDIKLWSEMIVALARVNSEGAHLTSLYMVQKLFSAGRQTS